MAHPEDFGRSPNGPNPMMAVAKAPEKFYRSLFAFAFATLRFKKMFPRAAQGLDQLSAIGFPEGEIAKKKASGPPIFSLVS